LLADLFPREKLSIAIGIFGLGAGIGTGAALLLGGAILTLLGEVNSVAIPFLGDMHRWQLVFLTLGLPGIALSTLIALTVKEPERAELFAVEGAPAPAQDAKGTLRDALRLFHRRQKVYGGIVIGMCLTAMVGYGFLAWMPTHMMRAFGWSAADVGLKLGIAVVLGGAGSTVAAGYVTNLLFARGYSDSPIRASVLALSVACPLLIVAVSAHDAVMSLVLYALGLFFVLMPATFSAIAVQLITPNRQRATMAAILVLTLNLLGLGVGPTLVALINDSVFSGADLGDALRVATACVLPLAIAAFVVCMPGLRGNLENLADPGP
jgi:hypothetical protein